jgi:CHAT domain-containing protein
VTYALYPVSGDLTHAPAGNCLYFELVVCFSLNDGTFTEISKDQVNITWYFMQKMLEYFQAKKFAGTYFLLLRNSGKAPLAMWQLFAASILVICNTVALKKAFAFQEDTSPTDQADLAMRSARTLIEHDRPADAANVLLRAIASAHHSHNTWQEARLQLVLSGCRLTQFDYREAMQTAETSRRLALKSKDNTTAGSAAINLATVYQQLGDVRLAGKEAAYAADLLKNSNEKRRLALALLISANVESERIRAAIAPESANESSMSPSEARQQIERNYRRGIEVTHNAGLKALEANFWEELGYSLLLAHMPGPAAEPFNKAYALEKSENNIGAMAVNKSHQAELQLQQKNYQSALKLIDEAFASKSPNFKRTPQYYSIHLRGVLLAHLNRRSEALTELRRAATLASAWREGALPGDTTSTRTVVVLHDVYQDYADLAAETAIEKNDNALARDALLVLAENRAANLREAITLSFSQKQKIPNRYFDLLAELQQTQARVLLGDGRPGDSARLDQIRIEMGNLENEFGAGQREVLKNAEKNPYRNSLRDIQSRLSSREVLLSFSLGKENAYLWAVTGERVTVYKLAGDPATCARAFSQSVQQIRNSASDGLKLSRLLFGSLPQDLWSKPDWLIVADGALYEGVPFAALPDLSKPNKATPLAESHNIRFLPSELLLLSVDKVNAQPRFLGVGDPIYNVADSRFIRGSGKVVLSHGSTALARLVGSEREVRNAAKKSGLAQSQFLIGREATASNLQKAIDTRPEILHFAVHVVSPTESLQGKADRGGQAAIALSLTSEVIPELLTPEAIATLRVPGSIVVLSGCSSQRGEVLPSAGLMGLGRAWLLAGASAVIVSAWATPDDSGTFFSSFYNKFNSISSGSLAERAAAALKSAQVEMEHGTGYRSTPSFWAAYSIFSKE